MHKGGEETDLQGDRRARVQVRERVLHIWKWRQAFLQRGWGARGLIRPIHNKKGPTGKKDDLGQPKVPLFL